VFSVTVSLLCLVTASDSGRSSAFGITSSQAGGHLTPNFYSSSPVKFCSLSSAQSFVVSGPLGTHGHIYVFSLILRVLKYINMSLYIPCSKKKGGISPQNSGEIQVGSMISFELVMEKGTQIYVYFFIICLGDWIFVKWVLDSSGIYDESEIIFSSSDEWIPILGRSVVIVWDSFLSAYSPEILQRPIQELFCHFSVFPTSSFLASSALFNCFPSELWLSPSCLTMAVLLH
jgi:hypothetical protein